jgi:hypothetical protein
LKVSSVTNGILGGFLNPDWIRIFRIWRISTSGRELLDYPGDFLKFHSRMQ